MEDYSVIRFACLTEKGRAEVRERPMPEIGEYDVVVKQLACNICTTDYTQWQGLREHQGYPMAGGHEGAGIVAAVGPGVKNIKVGDYVAHSTQGCGCCRSCVVGDYYNCEHSGGMSATTSDGYRGNFGFATYSKYHGRTMLKMNKDLDPAEAGFLEPVATAVQGIESVGVHAGDTVVVIGGGTMGIVNAQVARAYGGRVIVSELLEHKLEKARELGFEVIDCGKDDPVEKAKELTGGKGADIVIVAVGTTSANDQALQMIKNKDGRILFFAAGYPAPELKIDSNAVHYRRITLVGTMNATQTSYNIAAKLINSRIINVAALVEQKRFKLDDIQEAFAYADNSRYRVCVMIQDED